MLSLHGSNLFALHSCGWFNFAIRSLICCAPRPSVSFATFPGSADLHRRIPFPRSNAISRIFAISGQTIARRRCCCCCCSWATQMRVGSWEVHCWPGARLIIVQTWTTKKQKLRINCFNLSLVRRQVAEEDVPLPLRTIIACLRVTGRHCYK